MKLAHIIEILIFASDLHFEFVIYQISRIGFHSLPIEKFKGNQKYGFAGMSVVPQHGLFSQKLHIFTIVHCLF